LFVWLEEDRSLRRIGW